MVQAVQCLRVYSAKCCKSACDWLMTLRQVYKVPHVCVRCQRQYGTTAMLVKCYSTKGLQLQYDGTICYLEHQA